MLARNPPNNVKELQRFLGMIQYYRDTLETEYLGYIITRDGIKPHDNKVQAILVINPPKNIKELCRFIIIS